MTTSEERSEMEPFHTAENEPSEESAKKHWEDRYRQRDRIWSGRVNARLAEIVGGGAPIRRFESWIAAIVPWMAPEQCRGAVSFSYIKSTGLRLAYDVQTAPAS